MPFSSQSSFLIKLYDILCVQMRSNLLFAVVTIPTLILGVSYLLGSREIVSCWLILWWLIWLRGIFLLIILWVCIVGVLRFLTLATWARSEFLNDYNWNFLDIWWLNGYTDLETPDQSSHLLSLVQDLFNLLHLDLDYTFAALLVHVIKFVIDLIDDIYLFLYLLPHWT